MAPHPQALTLAPAAWSEDAQRILAPACPHDLADVAAQVQAGAARLFVGTDPAGQAVLAFVLRIDQAATGPQGVIVAAAGQVPGADLTATCMPAIESLFRGCVAIRYHTAHPALARKLARLGYVAREIVCFKEIHRDPLPA